MEEVPFDIGCARFLGVEVMDAQVLSCQKGDCMQDACMNQFHLQLRFSVGVRICDCGGECCTRRQFTRCITVNAPRGVYTAADFTGGACTCDMESFRMHEARGTATLCVTLNMPRRRSAACIEECACGSANSAIELTIEELEKHSGCLAWVDVCKDWA